MQSSHHQMEMMQHHSIGSGHLNPDSALDPGLVYDFDIDNLVDFLCSQNVDVFQLQNMIGKHAACKYEISAGCCLQSQLPFDWDWLYHIWTDICQFIAPSPL